jgi:hypothetical protein
MSTEMTAQAVGGFVGDPAEALHPPASADGCCGGPATTDTVEGTETVAATCCGTVAEAQASGGCCGEAAKAEAVASGAGCCR